ncbi:hypothetical protein Alches_23960 [Alicyclobacillus hesperidum subsp. aegles]|uniref:DUF3291 domain-containing protein n=1 Tax=Alicyclobacillus hesperidum TaxID=89784 RepID=UPI0007192502|nr:DUF3291 domain-containing protein [Alicyclobacillus hesperidum]KRW91510.1 hypothetical protein SD51_08460 [Alicyclobacillus tengchongensis]GLG02355.1 hypothetical protein Alches_23960 [Alicyclobacillus hesperidum subsp. aegles]
MGYRLGVYTVGFISEQSPLLANHHQFIRETLLAKVQEEPGLLRVAMPAGYRPPTPDVPVESGFLTYTMTVWRDLESVFHFTYKTHLHRRAMRELPDAYEKMPNGRAVYDVLWWFDDDAYPDDERAIVDEGARRMDYLIQEGPSPYAFDMKHPYDVHGLQADFRKLRDYA